MNSLARRIIQLDCGGLILSCMIGSLVYTRQAYH